MTELQIAGIFIAILLVMILMRIPIGISLIAVSFGGLWSMFNWNIAWGLCPIALPTHGCSARSRRFCSWALFAIIHA